MKEELKERAHKEFDELLLELQGQTDYSKYIGSFHRAKVKSFIDSLIDKTVQKTEDRIVGLIEKLRRTEPLYIGEIQYRFYEGNVDWVYNGALDDLLPLITNKSELSTNKDEK